MLTIREKKRIKGTLTTRRVPVSDTLAAILKEYLASRGDGLYLFGEGDQPLSVQATQKAFVRVSPNRNGLS